MVKLQRSLVSILPLVLSASACARAGSDAVDLPSPPSAAVRPGNSPVGTTPTAPGITRQEAVVQVGAVAEHWALVWRQRPHPICGPEEPDGALTCPCIGFAYGEAGELDLVRRRPGHSDERLALTPLFREARDDGPGEIDSLALLQRWPVLESDYADIDSDGLTAAIRARPLANVMVFGDYDHDGRATEFLLQVGTLPCGKRQAVLVGVSRVDSSMHVFSSLGHPERPLELSTYTWEGVRRSNGHFTAVEWPCGDHGSETQTEVSVLVGPAGFDGTRYEYECTQDNIRGRLLSSTRI